MALKDLNKPKQTLDPNDPNAMIDPNDPSAGNINDPQAPGPDVSVPIPSQTGGVGTDMTGDILPPEGISGTTGSVAPPYDPQRPESFINYYYNQEYGTNAPPEQLSYWTGKLNSNEQTGTWDPTTNNWKIADPAYWATRILRQGVDDVNPPNQVRQFLPLAPSNAPTLAALSGSGGGGAAPSADTSWMNGPPPGPGWVAVPGVGWVPPDNPAAQSYQAQQAASSGAATSTGAPNNTPASIDDQMRTAIMGLLQTPQTTDAQSLQNDPSVAAYRLSSTRAADRSRAQAVESAIQGGTYGSGALETQKAGIDQQRAEGEAQFVGQVSLQKMQANREQLAQGIQFAQSMGQFDKAQSLQLQLAQMDNAIRAAQVAQSGQLGNRSLDLQDLQLQQQAQQFLDSLGFNYTSLGVQANQAAYGAASGGG